MYIYIYIFVYIYIYVYIYIHICLSLSLSLSLYIYIYIHIIIIGGPTVTLRPLRVLADPPHTCGPTAYLRSCGPTACCGPAAEPRPCIYIYIYIYIHTWISRFGTPPSVLVKHYRSLTHHKSDVTILLFWMTQANDLGHLAERYIPQPLATTLYQILFTDARTSSQPTSTQHMSTQICPATQTQWRHKRNCGE